MEFHCFPHMILKYCCCHCQAPVSMYYSLTNFYQNHRRYVKSRDDNQLLGSSQSYSQLSSDCEPYRGQANDSLPGGGLAYAPCGAIANSLFNGEQFSDLNWVKWQLTPNLSFLPILSIPLIYYVCKNFRAEYFILFGKKWLNKQWWWEIPVLERTMKQLHWLLIVLSTGISRHHRLLIHDNQQLWSIEF